MAKTNVKTIRTIATLGKRELRYTDINGELKYDIRSWKGDEPEPGVRFTQEELIELKNGFDDKTLAPVKIGNKEVVYDKEWCLSVVSNGRTYTRPFATSEEIEKLFKVMEASNNYPLSYTEPVPEQPKKKRGRPKKSTAIDEVVDELAKKKKVEDLVKKYTSTTKKEEKSQKTYKNAHEKFCDQFAEYRKTQPDNRQKGFELTHKVITDHIKDIIATSDEYNKNAMQDWKNSHNLMLFVQDKAFENAEALMKVNTWDENCQLMCQFVDEYIGLDDKPKPKPKTTTKKTTKAKAKG